MRRPTKIARVLAALAAGQRIHRFQAERELHDHVLPTTIATIQQHGIQVHRRTITVPGYAGSRVHVAEYRLVEAEKRKARRLLREWGRRGSQKG
jgi:hypothetical protein